MPPHLPPAIPGYSALTLIGAGGMGRVYRAHDDRHHRRVAIKVLHHELPDPLAAARFEQEIRITARLAHPSILPVFDSGRVEDRVFYVMPLFEGRSLRELLRERGTLDPASVCRLGLDLADALAHAHNHGVVHRDIKPDNVLLSGERAALADFGLARALDEAEIGGAVGWLASGTPGYMSPEQAAGLDANDARSDLHALGLTLLEALNGDLPPHDGERFPPPHIRPSLRRWLDPQYADLARVLRRASARDPGARYSSARELLAALHACQDRPRAHRLILVATITGLLVAAGLATATLAGTRQQLVDTRIAVAALENRSGRSALDGLGAMAADWVVQGLQRAGGIEVVPTIASMSAVRDIASDPGSRDAADPPRALARATGARYIVTGAYFVSGDSLRIHAAITDARSGTLVGALDPVTASPDRPELVLDEFRSRIIAMFARHLDARAASGPGASARPPTLPSYDHFVRGLDAYSRTRWAEAVTHFRQASTLDPGFIQAELYEALSLSNLDDFVSADSLLDRVDARRDLLSDYDRQWMDYRRMMMRGDRPAALRAIRRAAAIAPASKASYNLAVELMEQGRPAEALDALRPLGGADGSMAGFVPYPATIAVLHHLLGAHRRELAAIRDMQRRYPEERWGLVLEMNALAALGREEAVLSRFDDFLATAGNAAGMHPLDAAAQVADELRRHGHPAAAATVLTAALDWWERRGDESGRVDALRRAWLLARLERWGEAAALTARFTGEADVSFDELATAALTAAGRGDREHALALAAAASARLPAYDFGADHFLAASLHARLAPGRPPTANCAQPSPPAGRSAPTCTAIPPSRPSAATAGSQRSSNPGADPPSAACIAPSNQSLPRLCGRDRPSDHTTSNGGSRIPCALQRATVPPPEIRRRLVRGSQEFEQGAIRIR